MPGLDIPKLADWYSVHGRTLVLFARQVLAPEDQASAEDVVQEVFTRLLIQAADGAGMPEPPNPIAWLYRCVRNACLDERRGRSRRRHHESFVAQKKTAWFEPYATDLIDANFAQEALATLPDLHRQVVTLRLWSGLTLADIADITGQPVSTVYDQYRMALSRVRATLERRSVALKESR